MKFFLYNLLLLSLFSFPLCAQWAQTNGPDGGLVSILTVNQSNGHIFAGTKGGAYRSTDDGVTWVWRNTGLPASIELSVVYSSGSDTYIYDGANTILYYSTDEGNSWTAEAGTGLPLLPSFGQMVTVGSKLLASVVGYNDQGVYVSSDHGTNWTKSSTGLPSNYQPAAMTVVGSNIFVGAYLFSPSQGVYISTDNGANWSNASTGYATTGGVIAFSNIGSTLFATTLSNGVYMTSNNGGNWTKISPTSPILVLGAKSLASTTTNLYIGSGAIFKANNTGGSWDTVCTGLPARGSGTAINALTAYGTTVIASFANLGLFRTTDAGAHWTKCNSGLHNGNIDGVYYDGSTLFSAGVTTGFFRSTNNGDSWSEINSGIDLRDNGYFNFIRSGSYLIAGGGLQGMLRSTDNGDTWVAGTLGSPAYSFVKDGNTIYTGVLGNAAKTTDDGTNWTLLNPGIPSYVAASCIWKIDSTILLGCSAGFKRSTNNGATWIGSYTGLPTYQSFHSFAQIDSTILVAHDQGVYRSTDHGATWSASTGIAFGTSPFALHVHGDFVFVGTTQGVYESTNRGATWTSISTGLNDKTFVNVLTSNNQYLIAGTNPNSVWRRPISEVTSVREINDIVPNKFTLDQNYPNPFNPTTTIKFLIHESGFVTLKVYNIHGEEVVTLVNQELHSGTFSASWNAIDQPSGVYYYQLISGNSSEIKKMLMIK